MLDALVERFVEADDHGGCGVEAGFEDGALRGEVFRDGVFEFGVTAAEVLGEDLRASAGDPAHACVFEARGGFGVRELRVVGEVEELGDGERVELECVAVAVTNGGEEVAVVVERQMRVEAAIECGEVAAEREQLIELREDRFLGEDVAALLTGELVEGAVVALGDADVGVVDDAHHHVGGAVGGMEAGADLCGEVAEFGVGGVLPEVAGVGGRDALAAVDLCGNRVGDGVGGVATCSLYGGDLPSRQRRDSPSEAKAPATGICHPRQRRLRRVPLGSLPLVAHIWCFGRLGFGSDGATTSGRSNGGPDRTYSTISMTSVDLMTAVTCWRDLDIHLFHAVSSDNAFDSKFSPTRTLNRAVKKPTFTDSTVPRN